MKRVIKALMMMALLAVILVASISPALARTSHFGKRLNPDRPCDVHLGIARAQNGRGAQLVENPRELPEGVQHSGCWLVLPGQDFSAGG